MPVLKSPNSASNRVRYRYKNRSSRIQLIRIANIKHFFLERTILPKIMVVFDAPDRAQIEIIQPGESVTLARTDTVQCCELTENNRSIDAIADISLERNDSHSNSPPS